MKVPEPRQLKSGNWFIQLRLGGESISVTDRDKKQCAKRAQYLKAEYLAGKRDKRDAPEDKPSITLGAAIDSFIAKRSNALSPSTIRGYQYIRKNRFSALMERDVYSISKEEWILACNKEATLCAPKTLSNAWRFIATVLKKEAEINPPEVALPQIPPNERPFLTAEQIPVFVSAVHGTEVEIPALLALSSLRRSEICALRWENIDLKNRLINVKGAAVYGEDQKLIHKKANKNKTSTRSVPIMMEELYIALSSAKKPSGLIVGCNPNTIWAQINRICAENDLPKVGVHGLRHSFASLAKHVGMPEQVTMEIGGWSNPQTMRKIYTHISQKDADRYKNAMSNFYKNANKNANEKIDT